MRPESAGSSGYSSESDTSSEHSFTVLSRQPARRRLVPVVRRRDRTLFSPEVTRQLEKAFNVDHYPGIQQREALSWQLGISEDRIQVWFQNRRSKSKRHGTNKMSEVKQNSKCWAGNQTIPPLASSVVQSVPKFFFPLYQFPMGFPHFHNMICLPQNLTSGTPTYIQQTASSDLDSPATAPPCRGVLNLSRVSSGGFRPVRPWEDSVDVISKKRIKLEQEVVVL